MTDPTIDTGFLGMYAGTDPERVPPGALQVADNVFISGYIEGAGGAVTTRPGERAQLSAAQSAFFNAKPYQKASGQQNVYLAAGNFSNTAGRVVEWVKDAPTVTYKTALGAFRETAVRFARLYQYLFITGATGTTGVRMKRYDPEADTVIDAEGIATPAYTATASRTNAPRMQNAAQFLFSEAVEWGKDSASATAIAITESDFTSGFLTPRTSGQQLCATSGWLVANALDTVEVATAVWSGDSSLRFVRLDGPGSGIKTDPNLLYVNSQKSNQNGVGSATRYVVHHQMEAYYIPTMATDSISAHLVAYTTAGVEVARDVQVMRGDVSGVMSVQKLFFSLAGQTDDAQAQKLGVELYGGAGNLQAATGPYVSRITLTPLEPAVPFSADATGSVRVAAYTPGTSGYSIQAQPTGAVYLGGQRLTYRADTTQSYAAVSQFAIEFNRLYDFSPFRVQLGLRQGTAGTAFYTDELGYARDESGKTYLYGDLSVIPAANRTAIQFLELYFPVDLTMPNGETNRGQTLFTVGKFLETGGLQPGLSYDWLFVEKETTSGLLSGGSPITNLVQATTFEASGRLSLTGVTLPSSTAANRVVPYRRGGTADGWFHKVGEFAPGADATGTYWSWDATARTFVDRTPDSVLERSESGAIDELFSDHQPPPTDVLEAAAYRDRLVLFTRNELWVSQVAPVTAAAGLYYNRVENRADPNFANQGFYTRIGDGSGDAVQRAVPFQEALPTFFTNSLFIFGGTDASDFYFRRFEGDEGAGLVSPYAVGVDDNALYYLAPDGLRRFDGLRTDVVSNSIRRLLNPKADFSGANLSAGPYRQSSFIGHAERLYLAVPATGGAVVSSTFVFDARPGLLPVRWGMGEVGGFFALNSPTDTDDLYVFTHDSAATAGMIYKIDQRRGDTHRLGDAPTAVVGTVRGRGVSRPGGDVEARRFGFSVSSPDAVTPSFQVTADSDALKRWASSYGLPAGGGTVRRLFVPRRVRGRYVEYEVSVTAATSAATINRVALTDAEERPLV